MNFEFELSKGKQNSLGETLKVVDFIKNNPKKVEHLFQCFYSENTLVAMRAMNGAKRIIKDDKKVFLKNKDRFLNQFSNSKHVDFQTFSHLGCSFLKSFLIRFGCFS